jgi:dihydroorotate dehydrogenase (NAD+) catalytic subunit
MVNERSAAVSRSHVDLSVDLAGIALRNPVMTASGTFGYGEEFVDYVDLHSIGAFVTKGLSLKPRAGNPTPRIVETPGGMLNAIGLQNVGIDAFIAKKVPFLRTVNTPAIANFFGDTVDEYAEMARRLDTIPEVAGLEMNISCPNVKQGGIVFGADPACAAGVVAACRAVTKKPLIVKLSPNVTDIVGMAHACEDAGADSLSLINTLVGMAIDLNKRRPVLANITGGFSGPAIKPIALRMVWQVAKAVKIPVIGIGGIMNATDALEFILAGATAVQVGTASFINPGAAQKIAEDMAAWLVANGVADVKSLIGALEV